MSQAIIEARARLDDAQRIHNRVASAIHRESERDVDVAQDRLELRIRAAVMTVLDEEVADRQYWLRQAQTLDSVERALGETQGSDR